MEYIVKVPEMAKGKGLKSFIQHIETAAKEWVEAQSDKPYFDDEPDELKRKQERGN